MSASIWDPSTPAGSTAATIPFTPTATLVANDVQEAIEEADTENRALLAAFKAALLNTASVSESAALFAYNPALNYLVGLGQFLNYLHARTAGEIAAGITPTNYAYFPGDIRRYGADQTGVAASDTAWTAAKSYATTSGDAIVFPQGTYKFAAQMLIDWNRARVDFVGKVTLTFTSAVTTSAIAIDGGASGFLYDVRFGESNGPFIRADFATNAIYCRSAHHCVVNAEVLSAVTAALQVNFSVLTEYGIRCTVNAQGSWISTRPVNGMKLDGRNTGEGVADCTFRNCIIEGVSGDGVVSTFAEACTFVAGTSEGNGGKGYWESTSSSRNKLVSFFCEANGDDDFLLDGSATELDNCTASSSTATCTISGIRNKITGGVFKQLTITSTAVGTVLDATAIISTDGGGLLSDSGVATIYQNVRRDTSTGSRSVQDVARKPMLKRVGTMAVAGATQATRCVVSISVHALDYGDSVTFASVGGMTQLNGNTYTVEPINSDTFYILSAGAYVNSTGFGAYTSGGTATLVAFNSTWANAGGIYRTLGFAKDASGAVSLFGTIQGSSLSGVAVFTLPSGFRPGGTVSFPIWELSGPSHGILQITSAGVVTPSTYTDGVSKVLSLDGVTFYSEN